MFHPIALLRFKVSGRKARTDQDTSSPSRNVTVSLFYRNDSAGLPLTLRTPRVPSPLSTKPIPPAGGPRPASGSGSPCHGSHEARYPHRVTALGAGVGVGAPVS